MTSQHLFIPTATNKHCLTYVPFFYLGNPGNYQGSLNKSRFLIQQITMNGLKHARGSVLPSDRYINTLVIETGNPASCWSNQKKPRSVRQNKSSLNANGSDFECTKFLTF